jgi:hypothetical protein
VTECPNHPDWAAPVPAIEPTHGWCFHCSKVEGEWVKCVADPSRTLAAGSVPAADTPDEGYAPGMRDHEPDICWRLLGGGNACIKPRGHDDGDHEPADNTGKEQT